MGDDGPKPYQLWISGPPGSPSSLSPGETQAVHPSERDRGEKLRVHGGLPAPGGAQRIVRGGLMSAAPGRGWAPRGGSQLGWTYGPPGGPAVPGAAGPLGPQGLEADAG